MPICARKIETKYSSLLFPGPFAQNAASNVHNNNHRIVLAGCFKIHLVEIYTSKFLFASKSTPRRS